MRKALFAVLAIVALSLVLVTPAAADQGGIPNDNAAFGQTCAAYAQDGPGTMGADHQYFAKNGYMPLAWGKGGVPGGHNYTHGPELPP